MGQSQCVKDKTINLESQDKITDFDESQCLKDGTIECESIMSVTIIECIGVLLSSSRRKAWSEVNLSGCHICGYFRTIYCKLRKCSDVTIEVLKLNKSSITSADAHCVSEIVLHCKVQKLFINGNHNVGESKQLYIMLTSPDTNLKILHMRDVKLLNNGVDLFMALQQNNTLKELIMTNNDITDVACEPIATALKDINNCLTKLWIYENEISGKTSIRILDAVKCNNSLESLVLPNTNESTASTLKSLAETVNKEREDRGCNVRFWFTDM